MNFTKEITFPLVRAIPEPKITNFLKRLWRFLTYRRKWEVMEDYILWVECIKKYIIIPKGFIFDGASVPKILHSLLGPTGLLLLGACPHDFGYRYHGLIVADEDSCSITFKHCAKHQIDIVFQNLCQLESSVVTSAWLAEKAVQWFGDSSWNHNVPSVYEDFQNYMKVWCDIN